VVLENVENLVCRIVEHVRHEVIQCLCHDDWVHSITEIDCVLFVTRSGLRSERIRWQELGTLIVYQLHQLAELPFGVPASPPELFLDDLCFASVNPITVDDLGVYLDEFRGRVRDAASVVVIGAIGSGRTPEIRVIQRDTLPVIVDSFDDRDVELDSLCFQGLEQRSTWTADPHDQALNDSISSFGK
jgi:hypothetical protein